jgi:hypothetical protein
MTDLVAVEANEEIHSVAAAEANEVIHNPDEDEEEESIDEEERIEFERRKKEFEDYERKFKSKDKGKTKTATTDVSEDSQLAFIAEPEYVHLDFLVNGYNWKVHMTSLLQNDLNTPFEHVDSLDGRLVLPHDLFNTQLGVNMENAWKYNNYLNIKNEEPNITNCLQRIEKIKKDMSNTIITIWHKFWFDIANKLNLTCNKKYLVHDDKTLRLAIQQCQTFQDCRKVYYLLYLCFDYLPFYQRDIATHVESIHNVTVLTPPLDGKKRQTQNFLISLISHELNTQRFHLCKHAYETLGLKFQLKQTPGTFKKIQGKKQKKYIYPWNITGTLVSQLMDCVLI